MNVEAAMSGWIIFGVLMGFLVAGIIGGSGLGDHPDDCEQDGYD